MNKETTLEKFQDIFYTYVNVLCRRIAERESGLCEMEKMSGCLYWNVAGQTKDKNTFSHFYATPFWENEEVVPISLRNEDGEYVGDDEIPFTVEELTMHVERDAERYGQEVRKHFKEKYNVVIPEHGDLSHL